jgi:hypothetical protein
MFREIASNSVKRMKRKSNKRRDSIGRVRAEFVDFIVVALSFHRQNSSRANQFLLLGCSRLFV